MGRLNGRQRTGHLFVRGDFLYEINKWDAFRALAHMDGHSCRLLSERSTFSAER